MQADMIARDELSSDGFSVAVHESKLLALDLIRPDNYRHIVKVIPTQQYGGVHPEVIRIQVYQRVKG